MNYLNTELIQGTFFEPQRVEYVVPENMGMINFLQNNLETKDKYQDIKKQFNSIERMLNTKPDSFVYRDLLIKIRFKLYSKNPSVEDLRDVRNNLFLLLGKVKSDSGLYFQVSNLVKSINLEIKNSLEEPRVKSFSLDKSANIKIENYNLRVTSNLEIPDNIAKTPTKIEVDFYDNVLVTRFYDWDNKIVKLSNIGNFCNLDIAKCKEYLNFMLNYQQKLKGTKYFNTQNIILQKLINNFESVIGTVESSKH